MANDFVLACRADLNGAKLPRPPEQGVKIKPELTVLFTGLPGTLSALRKAADIARSLNASIRLLVVQVVPYPLPLNSPPVLLEFNRRRCRAIAEAQAIETRVEIFLCRDVDDSLGNVLPHGSPVVIGGRKRWWPTSEARMARRLRRRGYATVFTAEEDHQHA